MDLGELRRNVRFLYPDKRFQEELVVSYKNYLKQVESEEDMRGSFCRDTFVDADRPKISDGSFVVLDLGGSYVRIALAGIRNGELALKFPKKFKVSGLGLYKSSNLDEFLNQLSGILIENFPSILNIGFSFSFGIKKTSPIRGVVDSVSKGFEVPGVVGCDLGEVLQKYLYQRTGHRYCVCFLNDATAGFLAGHNRFGSSIHVVVGTGFNVAYAREDGRIINTEIGHAEGILNHHRGRLSDSLHELVSGSGLPFVYEKVLNQLGISVKANCFKSSLAMYEHYEGVDDCTRLEAMIIREIFRQSAFLVGTFVKAVLGYVGYNKDEIVVSTDGGVFDIPFYMDDVLESINLSDNLNIRLARTSNNATLEGAAFLVSKYA